MTRKEKLYFEYLSIRNEIYTVKGLGEKVLNLDEYINTSDFQRSICHYKVYELKDCIKSAHRELEKVKKKAERLAWFETDEGKKLLEDNEKELKKLSEEQEDLNKKTLRYANDLIHILLGNDFEITGFGLRSFTVSLLVKSEDEPQAKHIAHYFTVYYNKHWMNDDFEYELNYGASSSLSLGRDVNHTRFLIGMATFASREEFTLTLKERLRIFYEQYRALDREIDRLNRVIDGIDEFKPKS